MSTPPPPLLLGAALALATLAAAPAQEDSEAPPPGDPAIHNYLAARAAELEAGFLPDVASADDFEALRPRLRQQYLYMLGLDPLPERTPINAAVTGRIVRDDFTVEMLHFQSRPGLYVTANLYLPGGTAGLSSSAADARDRRGRHPAVLYVCGHSGMGRNGNKTAFQEHGIWFATHGYVCLVLDTLQLGEIAATHHGTYREGRWWWQSRGYTPAGVECWNGIRGIDYLTSRDDVDPERIAVTGISGGGAATFWIAAADPRVACAIPVSGMADLKSYVTDQVVNGHCDCMFLYNTYRWNWTNIAALICPRPLLFMNSNADAIFPMDANQRVINRLEHLYGYFGAGDRVDAVVSIGGHAYRQDLYQAAYRFINTHLRGDPRVVEDWQIGQPTGDPPTPVLPPESLRVFPTDADIPADELNTTIDQHFVPIAEVELPEPDDFDAWREHLLAELRDKCFRAWPDEFLADEAPRACSPPYEGGAGGVEPHDPRSSSPNDPITSDGTEETQPGIAVELRFIEGDPDQPERWLVVLGPDDPQATTGELPAWAADFVGDAPAILLNPRGVGGTRWTRNNPPNTVERSLALLGETADSGRVWDVLATLRRRSHSHSAGGLAPRTSGNGVPPPPPPWNLIGRGQAGVIAAYAALYEPAVQRLVLVEPPASHMPDAGHRPAPQRGPGGGPTFLNVLRVLDIPEALGLLAPRRLTLVTADQPAFDRTQEIYRRAGAEQAIEFQSVSSP